MYNTMQYANKNTTDYLVRFLNTQKVNVARNRSLITKGVQDHGMNIIFPLHNTGFDSVQKYEKKEAEKAREEILCAILYLDNSEKARFVDLKKRVGSDYVLNKAKYPRTVTAVQSLLLRYQHNYNANRNYQSNGVRNQLMFAQRGKTGYNLSNRKEKEQRPRRNLDNITCNNFRERGNYAGNND